MKYLTFRLFSLVLVLLVSTMPTHANQRSDFSEAQLDAMLAPVALYPDTILSHILIAATYPLEIVQADRWARANPSLEGEAAVNAVENEDWEPSVKALVAFPHILQRLSDDLAWTQQLGDAFLDDEGSVMDAIQRLRRKAYDAGSLERMEHVKVQREKEVIVIEPAVERVVYVPVYDTRVVYGNWWWADYPPVYWHYPSSYVFVHGFYWGPRIYVGPSFYFSSFHWHRRHVVYVDYHHQRHRPHFHTGRSIVNYQGAAHWRHNPTHRRGVAYHNERVRQHYGSNRDSYSRVYENRGAPARRQVEQGHVTRDSRQTQHHRYREADRVRQQLGNGSEQRREGTIRTNRDNQGSWRENRQTREQRGSEATPNREAREQLERFNSNERSNHRTGPSNTTRPSTQDPRQSTPRVDRRDDSSRNDNQSRHFSNEASPTPEARTHRDSGRVESRPSRETVRSDSRANRDSGQRQVHRTNDSRPAHRESPRTSRQ